MAYGEGSIFRTSTEPEPTVPRGHFAIQAAIHERQQASGTPAAELAPREAAPLPEAVRLRIEEQLSK